MPSIKWVGLARVFQRFSQKTAFSTAGHSEVAEANPVSMPGGTPVGCYGPNCRRTFDRITTVWIWRLIWHVGRIVENSGEDEGAAPI